MLGFGLGFGFGRGRGAVDASYTEADLYFAAPNNRLFNWADSSSTRRRRAVDAYYVLPYDAVAFSIGVTGWVVGNDETDMTHTWTVEGASVLLPDDGAAAQFTYDAGAATSKAIPAGTAKQLSDIMLATELGQSYIPAGTLIHIKMLQSVPNNGDGLQFTGNYTSENGGASKWYSDDSTPSGLLTQGNFTFTGGTQTGDATSLFTPILLAVPLSPSSVKSWLIIGDSRTWGLGDNISRFFGRGFPHMSMNDGTGHDIIAACSVAASGIPTSAFTGSNTKWRAWLPFANRFMNNIGTNTVGGSNLSQMQTEEGTIHTAARAGLKASNKILRVQMAARTNSASGNFTGGADQTKQYNGWGLAETRDQFNTWVAGQVGTTIDGTVGFNGVTTGTYTNCEGWISAMTSDGTHETDNTSGKIGNATAAPHLRANGILAMDSYTFPARSIINPNTLSPLAIWDFNTGVWADTAGTTPATTTIARVDDQSGNGRHLLQATGANQPSKGAAIGGKGSAAFTASAHRLDWPTFFNTLPNADHTVLTVYKQDSNPGGDRWMYCGSNLFGVYIGAAGVISFCNAPGWATRAEENVATDLTNPHFILQTRSGTAAGGLKGRRDGGKCDTVGQAQAVTISGNIVTGNYASGGSPFQGRVLYQAVLPGGLTRAQLEGISNWVQQTYGINSHYVI